MMFYERMADGNAGARRGPASRGFCSAKPAANFAKRTLHIGGDRAKIAGK